MKKILLLPAMLFCVHTFAQQIVQVNSDRPDETDGTYIIEKGYLQIEHGFFYEKEKTDQLSITHYGLQDMALRLGIMRKVEFQLLYLLEQDRYREPKSMETGLAATKIGLKYNVGSQKGVIPSFSVFGSMNFPLVVSKAFKTDHTHYTAALLFQHEFDDYEIGYNAGFTKQRNDAMEWVFTLSLVKEFNDKLSGFVEHYSTFQQKESDISFDMGIAYSVSKLLVLDVAAGITVNHNAHFFTVGFAYLLPKKLF